MLDWELEAGIRMSGPGSVGAPRFQSLPDGGGRMHCCSSEFGAEGPAGGEELSQGVISSLTADGLHFELEPEYRLQSGQSDYDSNGITAAEVVAPEEPGDRWTMLFSAWQDVPPGTEVPLHPSADEDAVESGLSEDFAAASIASDLAGYRSRIYVAYSDDGMEWERGGSAIEGAGYDGEGLDAVHAEDMSVIKLGTDRYRMYYACCDTDGNWRIASAVSATGE